jgi:hypothetical protein
MWQRSKGLKVFNCRQRQALTPHSSSRKFADQSRRSSSPSSTMILRASVHECKGASVYKNGAKCWVQGAMFSAGVLPIRYSPFTIRHSLLAIRCRFTICRSHSLTRHSLLAAVFGSAGISPSHFFPVPRPATLVPLKVGARFLCHQRMRTKNP